MALNTCAIVFLVFSVTSHTIAHDVSSVLIKHIERLDAKIDQLQENHQAEIREIQKVAESHKADVRLLEEKLKTQKTDYDRKLAELGERLSQVEEINGRLREENDQRNNKKKKTGFKLKSSAHAFVNNDRDDRENVLKQKKKHGRLMADSVETEVERSEIARRRSRRAFADGYNVAFSAYMDQDVDGLGAGQTLIYNQIILNDGNGYNNHTGIFTAPVPGVYSFSFFIGERDNNDEWVALYVNSMNTVDAAVQPMHATQDLQGGNTVNVKLALGDVVYVKNLGNGHVEGSPSLRLTTFSGFLLYPVESSVIIGK